MVRVILVCVCVAASRSLRRQAYSRRPPRHRLRREPRACRLAREEKQKSATPYTPNALERGMRIAERRLMPLLAAPDGVHLKLGSLDDRQRVRLWRRIPQSAACSIGRAPSSVVGGGLAQEVLGRRSAVRPAGSRRRPADDWHLRPAAELPAGRFLRHRPGRPPRRSHELSARRTPSSADASV